MVAGFKKQYGDNVAAGFKTINMYNNLMAASFKNNMETTGQHALKQYGNRAANFLNSMKHVLQPMVEEFKITIWHILQPHGSKI